MSQVVCKNVFRCVSLCQECTDGYEWDAQNQHCKGGWQVITEMWNSDSVICPLISMRLWDVTDFLSSLFFMSVFSIASMFQALYHPPSLITLSSDINECETITEACQGEMKCFNHYGGYLCLPRSASLITAPEPSGQSESGLPGVSGGAFSPCPVGYEAQGESCIGKI